MTDLPTPPEIRKAKKAELVAWAESLGLNAEGKVDELRARLLEHVASAAKAPKAEKKAPKPQPAKVEPPPPAEVVEEEAEGEAEEEAKEEAEVEEKEEKKPKGKEKEEREHTPKLKPQLTPEIRALLRLRRQVANRRPTFRRQEWFTHAGLGQMWRKPQGQHSKLRRHLGYRPNVVSIGYRGPKAVRGLHPSGFREVLVHRVRDLDAIDPKLEAARIAGTVGGRRRTEIESAADEKGIRVLNRREEE